MGPGGQTPQQAAVHDSGSRIGLTCGQPVSGEPDF